MWMYDTETGKPVEVPDEQVAEVYRSGKAAFKKGTRIPIIAEDGSNPGSVLAEDLEDALSIGMRVETATERQSRQDEKKYGSLGQEVITGLEGAASGATLGLSRVVQEALNNDAASQAGRARTNPVVSVASEIGGAVLPVIATEGGAAPASGARAATLIPTVGASRAGVGVAKALGAGEGVVGRMVASGVEAGIQSAGMQLSEDVLEQSPSTPGKFLSSVGFGGLVGSGTAGVLGLAGKFAPRIGGAAPPKGATASTLDAAREAIEEGAEADPTTFAGKIADAVLGKDRARATKKWFGSRETRDLGRMAESDANRMFIDGSAGLMQMADDVQGALDQGMRVIKKSEINAGLAGRDPAAARQRAFELLHGVDGIRFMAEQMKLNPADFGDVKQIQQIHLQVKKIEKILGVKRTKDPVTGVFTYALDPKKAPSAKEIFEVFDQVRHNFDNIAHLGEAASAIERPAANVAKGLRKGIKEFLEDGNMFGSAAAAQAKWNGIAKEFIDAGDEFFETGMFGKRAGYIGGKPDFKVNPGSVEAFFKSLGEPGNELRKASFLKFLEASKRVADEFADDANLQTRLAGTYKQTAEMAKLAKAMATLRQVKGKVTGVEQAVQSSIGRHLFGAALGGVAGGPLGAVMGAAAPLLGASVIHVLDRAIAQRGAVIARLSKVIAKGRPVRDRVPVIATRVFNENRFSDRKYARPARSKQEGFMRFAAEVTALKEDSKFREETVAASLEPIVEAAPRLAMATLQTWETGFQYIASNMPKSPDVSPFAPPGVKIPPSDEEIDRIANITRAVADPLTLLEDVAAGHATPEARDAVIAVYPDLYAEMREEVAKAMDDAAGTIPYEQRLHLAMFFSFDELEPSLAPENIIAAQQPYLEMPGGPGAPGGPGPGKATKSTKSLKSIAMAASAADRIEGREVSKNFAT